MRIRLKAALLALGVSQNQFAVTLGLSPAALSQIVNHNQWPKTPAPDALKTRIREWLRERVREPETLERLFEEWPEQCANTAPAAPQMAQETTEDEAMLLRNESLTSAARDAWDLPRSPFVDDIGTLDDIYSSASTRRARAALMDAAMNQGFMALVGESGSGKTTLREELEELIRVRELPVTVIKPYVMEMAEDDVKGRAFKVGQVVESIVHTLAPGVSIRRTAQARAKQVHKLLIDSQTAGYNNLLIIEEAHRMPKSTLRQLKPFLEMKNGLRRVLGIILIGQPELDNLLSERIGDVREIVQRIERREMLPLDNDLQDYVEHKFSRIGISAADIFEADVYDAIRARLVRCPRGGKMQDVTSICFPLVVNNLLCRAMNATAARGMPKVTAQAVKEC